MASVGDRVQAFLNQFSGGSGAAPGAPQGFDIAGVQKLPSQRPGQGPNRQLQQWDAGAGRSGTYKMLDNYQFLDDEMPNPFGGGSAPYMPGASLPGTQGFNIAGVLGESNGRANWAGRPKFSPSGPATDLDFARQDARRSLYRDLQEPPNPFGGGSSPYMGPV
jgi:hypothetical protein